MNPYRNTETYRRAGEIVLRDVGATTYLVDLRHNSIHQLNPVGAAVWEQLGEPASRGELAETIRLAFPEADRDVVERDLQILLDCLEAARLVSRI